MPKTPEEKIRKPLDDLERWKEIDWWPPWREGAKVCYATCDCVRFGEDFVDIGWKWKERACQLHETIVPVEVMEQYIKGKVNGKNYRLVHARCRYKFPDWEVVVHLPGFYLLEEIDVEG